MYNNNYSDIELRKFNSYHRKDAKTTDMSVYEHLMFMYKTNIHISKNCLCKALDEITFFINTRKRLKGVKEFSRAVINKSINRLAKFGLIEIDKSVTPNRIMFVRFFSNVDTNVDNNPQDVAVDTTDVEVFDNSTKEHNSINIIDNYTKTEVPFLGESLPKCESWNDVATVIEDCCKEVKLRSPKQKAEVITRIENNLHRITKKFSYNYILKVAISVKSDFQARRDQFMRDMFSKKSSFCDFEQRDYNFNDLEKKLLGWDS